jgi:hypothetical protein
VIALGTGKRLFADGTIPASFEVTESAVTSKGVIFVNYVRAAQSQPEVDKHSAGPFDLAGAAVDLRSPERLFDNRTMSYGSLESEENKEE